MSSTIKKYHIYQIYRSGNFLGVLPNVSSDFEISQDINSAGVSLTIEVGDTPDRQRIAPEPITTESEDPITTEANEIIYTERSPDIIGNYNSASLIRNNNEVKVFEVSSYYPAGKQVFSGYISKWKAKYGAPDDIVISCLSNGQELDNYLVQSIDTVDQSQASTNATRTMLAYGKAGDFAEVIQGFVVGSGVTNVSSVEFKIAAYAAIDVGQLMQADLFSTQSDAQNGINSLGTVTQALVSTTATVQKFTFPTSIPASAGATYYAKLKPVNRLTNYVMSYQNSNPYTGAIARIRGDFGLGAGYIGAWLDLDFPIGGTGDFYFKTYYSSGATNSPFSSTDPISILRQIVDAYVAAGGTINYASGTTVLAGTSVNYTFKVNTLLEGIKKSIELAPSNYYWYVDPATDILYAKPTSSTADVTFTLGRHIESLELEASVEEVKTSVYFTGGDVGGNVNLFITRSSVSALAANAGRIGLARITDNRVTLSDTADTIADNYLDENNAEVYHTVLHINDRTYDTTLLNVGQVVGFGGFGNFIDNLLLLIVHIDRTVDGVTLTLGALPRRASAKVEDIERRLNQVETLYNPSTPS